MSWYGHVLQFVAGFLVANGVPHFVHGSSGAPFQTPFAKPPGIGESSPLINVIWGFFNLALGFALLRGFAPNGDEEIAGWVLVGLGALLSGIMLARHFGRVRAKTP